MPLGFNQQITVLHSDVATPVSLFLSVINGSSGVLLESAEPDGRWGRYSLVGCDFVLVLTCIDGKLNLEYADPCFAELDPFKGVAFAEGLRSSIRILEFIQGNKENPCPPITRGLYGCMHYDAAGYLDSSLTVRGESTKTTAMFALPGTVFLFDHTYQQLLKLTLVHGDGAIVQSLPTAASEEISEARSLVAEEMMIGFEELQEQVLEAQSFLRDGEASQFHLSLTSSLPFHQDLFSAYRELRRTAPSPYMFFMRHGAFSLAVSSPEVLVGCAGRSIRLSPGSGGRSGELRNEKDIFLAEGTEINSDEQATHILLVEQTRSDLGKIAVPSSIILEKYMEASRFAGRQHLSSLLTGKLQAQSDILDVCSAFFPSGSVSGVPRYHAMRCIAAIEQTSRGPYGGAMGWLGLDQEGVYCDLGTINRALWQEDGQVSWQVGATVTETSDVLSLWKELREKNELLQNAMEVAGKMKEDNREELGILNVEIKDVCPDT